MSRKKKEIEKKIKQLRHNNIEIWLVEIKISECLKHPEQFLVIAYNVDFRVDIMLPIDAPLTL